MPTELKIPAVGESITEVEIGAWLKKAGDFVRKDEPIVSLESEKATVELPAPDSGVLTKVLKEKGEVARVGEVIGLFEIQEGLVARTEARAATAQAPVPAAKPEAPKATPAPRVMPAAQRALDEAGLSAGDVPATGPGGRLLKEDVIRHVTAQAAQETETEAPPPSPAVAQDPELSPPQPQGLAPGREEETVPMSRLRRTIAERLVEAQHTAALLTTFNEIDMSAILDLRKHYGEAFQKRYGIKLGFMSFFVKACVDALKQFPVLNAEVRGTNVAYRNYYDIGIAIGGGKGLVVPVLRNAEHLSFAEVEKAIAEFAGRAKENKLKLEELQGGTFTITNGGVYGSLLSTPIVNPPQSGVLGMHAIQQRPIAHEGAVVIRPMMYVALTYDHRIVDGREAVSFLRRIKEVVESPARILMEV
jgi:2-oxoglutarate dehydrogenase E2 component (dihydrolipoamide succinyltransferase)